MRKTPAQRLRHPCRHDGACGRNLVEIFLRELGQDSFEALLDLSGAEPCQGSDNHSCHPMRGHQLPAGSVAQVAGVLAEVQSPIVAGGEIHRADRIPRRQT